MPGCSQNPALRHKSLLMTNNVYYNENDPFAAAWLRELMAAGAIPQGVVDERSIVEVAAADLAEFTQCHFFAGIGVWASPYVKPVGRKMSSAGRDLARANHSLWPESEPAHPMGVTCGPRGLNASASAALSQSLANKLRAMTDSHGSMLFRLIWKTRITPAGRLIPALRASALRTFGKDCTSWPSPMAGTPAQHGYNEAGNTDSSRRTVALVSWPTPNADDANNATRDSGQFQSLTRTAMRASPSSRDWKDSPGMAQTGTNPDGSIRYRWISCRAKRIWRHGQHHDQWRRGTARGIQIARWIRNRESKIRYFFLGRCRMDRLQGQHLPAS